MIFRIFDPATITFSYYDEFGEFYTELPSDVDVTDQPFTESEAMTVLRSVRNSKLVACDYTQLPDVGIDEATIEAWRVYRQQLRDITKNLEWNVTTWPDRP